jgi:hypothetical protein
MKPQLILQQVCMSADVLVDAAQPYAGLLPSLLDRATGRMLTQLPPPIPGQRNADRAHGGCNLMHDEPLLGTLLALTQATGRPHYAQAAQRYLARFASHCTDTVSGLFPWGEHAYWDLTADNLGDSYRHHDPARPLRHTHDHLRAAPRWLWERLWAVAPDRVLRFAEGLSNHWSTAAPGEPREYIRHALIQKREPFPRDLSSADFPRHSGFYVYDLAFAVSRSSRGDLLALLREFADYWWTRRDVTGLCRMESRPNLAIGRSMKFAAPAPGQTLSLGVSLAEAGELLRSTHPELATELSSRAAVYINGFLNAPHDPDRGVFLISCLDDGSGAMPIWGSRYGEWPAAYVALTALAGHRITGDARLLDWARAVGRVYVGTAFPQGVAVPAMDAGLALGLLADLYDLTGEAAWRDAGLTLASDLMARYLDRPIPRGAAGIDWYESQMGPGFLLHGLARIALLTLDRQGCPLEADYTAR